VCVCVCVCHTWNLTQSFIHANGPSRKGVAEEEREGGREREREREGARERESHV